MKTKQRRLVAVLVVAGLALCLGAVATQTIVQGERAVSIEQVPAAVRATILAQAQGNTINEIEVETQNGQTVYEAEVIAGGRTTDIKVAADGTLLGTEPDEDEADDEEEEAEEDEQVSLAQVPEAVKATIAKEAAGAEIKEIEKETEDGKTIYSVEVILNGQQVDFEIAPDGTLLGKEVEGAGHDK